MYSFVYRSTTVDYEYDKYHRYLLHCSSWCTGMICTNFRANLANSAVRCQLIGIPRASSQSRSSLSLSTHPNSPIAASAWRRCCGGGPQAEGLFCHLCSQKAKAHKRVLCILQIDASRVGFVLGLHAPRLKRAEEASGQKVPDKNNFPEPTRIYELCTHIYTYERESYHPPST